jgi:hypothetical protein
MKLMVANSTFTNYFLTSETANLRTRSLPEAQSTFRITTPQFSPLPVENNVMIPAFAMNLITPETQTLTTVMAEIYYLELTFADFTGFHVSSACKDVIHTRKILKLFPFKNQNRV